MSTSELGLVAEEYVAQYLESKGYQILDRNFRKPWGELDLVAEKEGVVIFVEVKASKMETLGFEPEVRGSHDKLKKVVRTARTYLAEKCYPSYQPWQVDLVAVVLDQSRNTLKIRHYKNIEF